jgi:hypothetical protein
MEEYPEHQVAKISPGDDILESFIEQLLKAHGGGGSSRVGGEADIMGVVNDIRQQILAAENGMIAGTEGALNAVDACHLDKLRALDTVLTAQLADLQILQVSGQTIHTMYVCIYVCIIL